jgi:hypothetical protein
MRGLFPSIGRDPTPLTRHERASRVRATLSHKGRGKKAEPANPDGRSAAISAMAVPDYATMAGIYAVQASNERQATMEDAHAVQGFAENA